MSTTIYTAISFAPVQEFLEKTTNLRDLYGSYFILTYLTRAVCKTAKKQGFDVIFSAITNIVQGSNQEIIIRGLLLEKDAIASFRLAWKTITHTCRTWIEKNIPGTVQWRKEWELCTNHAWEFFWVQGESVSQVWRKLKNIKRQHNWVGINWQGESSLLSGTDAIAYFGMGSHRNSTQYNFAVEAEKIRSFYQQLSQLDNSLVDKDEQLSILELIKRLVTFDVVAKQFDLPSDELPSREKAENFGNLNRLVNKSWTGWFYGKSDSILNCLIEISNYENEGEKLKQFSQSNVTWSKNFLKPSVNKNIGEIIYADSHDFLGIFCGNYAQKLNPQKCLDWLYSFPRIWEQHEYQQNITSSIGFVWAAPRVGQRDILKHCWQAQNSANKQGGDRMALRILFNSGNWIEWVCPWWFLEVILESYNDRKYEQNWEYIYNDVAFLQSRHAFSGNQSEVALGIFEIYFGRTNRTILEKYLWDIHDKAGILGNHPQNFQNLHQNLNNWIINLSKVGFYLTIN
jgi:CRISPR-associated protein Cmr2